MSALKSSFPKKLLMKARNTLHDFCAEFCPDIQFAPVYRFYHVSFSMQTFKVGLFLKISSDFKSRVVYSSQ